MYDFQIRDGYHPCALIVLDGWGIAPAWGGNAITVAQTPVYSKIWQKYPSTSLLASGEAAGLPINSPGNSEAGHLNIGAGRVVHQDITLIDSKIDDGSFFKDEVLIGAVEHSRKYNSNIHIMGLLSDTGTHSHVRHLYSLLEMLKQQNAKKIFIHLFSDGRDSDPMYGIELVAKVEEEIKKIGVGQISSICGRFFAMDRDNRWGRISRAYNLLVKGEGNCYESTATAFSSAYASGQTDEFIEPRAIANKTQHFEKISNNDAIILFNFRSDRVKEITKAFLADRIDGFSDRVKLNNLYFASFAIYEDDSLSKKVFAAERIDSCLARVWSDAGLRQYHTSETEKFPHVTYFINGAIEVPFPGESRFMIPSPRDVKTYDLKPEMNAKGVTDNLVKVLDQKKYNAFIVNFANTDMVGHTGNFQSTVSAAEFVDECLGRVLQCILKYDGVAFVMADHGNAEQMVNPRTGDPDTEHTTNPVPFIMVSENEKLKSSKFNSGGILASVAPTILEVMGIPKPIEMVNESLIIKAAVPLQSSNLQT